MIYIIFVVAVFSSTVAVILNGKRLKEKRRANHNYEVQDLWYRRWCDELADNVKLDNDFARLLQEHKDLGENFDAYKMHIAEDLKALDQGTMEIIENYQQELLSEYDKVSDLSKLVEALEKIRLDHQVYCLPSLGEQILDENEEGETPIFESVVMDRAG